MAPCPPPKLRRSDSLRRGSLSRPARRPRRGPWPPFSRRRSQPESQAYAKIIEGNIALKNGERPKAIAALTDATKLLDTWIGRFDLGRAYLDAGLLLEADSEFDRCLKRRGEAMALFLDETPTFGYFPPVYYYLGRVRELNGAGFQESYRNYLNIRGKADEDPLLRDIQKRLGS